jgi:hypothetical protein
MIRYQGTYTISEEFVAYSKPPVWRPWAADGICGACESEC